MNAVAATAAILPRIVDQVQARCPSLASRLERAAEILASGGVTRRPDGSFLVASQSGKAPYAVSADFHCGCGDSVWRQRRWCKHALAAWLFNLVQRRPSVAPHSLHRA